MKNKSGITIVSLIVYVILLTAFTGIALIVSDNLSSSLFEDKAEAINVSNYDKMLYYLNKSAVESQSASISQYVISFSNGDIYTFNDTNGTFYFNGNILAQDISNFEIANVTNNTFTITVTFSKYTHTLQREITIYVKEI